MEIKIQKLGGMADVLPDQSGSWLSFEEIIRDAATSYGYKHIRTPILEKTGLFTRSIGEATDIVEKEMYTFMDYDESVTMRPENTASCVRAVLENNLLYNAPQRLWYLGPMFRHEKQQLGRYRQFHQMGMEALGFFDPAVDVELIEMTYQLWKKFGIDQHVELQINNLGQKEERKAHREALIAYFEQHQDILDKDAKRRLYTNPLRILDSKEPSMQEMIEAAPKLKDYLTEESICFFDTVKSMLDTLGIAYVENPRLVRGLDYYNLTVFEWVTSELGSQGTVCGGGRYDGLVEELGGKPTPGVGFAMGLERLLLLIQAKGQLTDKFSQPDVYIAALGEGTSIYALKAARCLRDAGFKVLQHAGGGNFKKQMKYADASGALCAIIVGENEVTSNTFTLKHLRQEQEQQTLTMENLINQLNNWKI